MPDFYTVPATGLQDALKRSAVALFSEGDGYLAIYRGPDGAVHHVRDPMHHLIIVGEGGRELARSIAPGALEVSLRDITAPFIYKRASEAGHTQIIVDGFVAEMLSVQGMLLDRDGPRLIFVTLRPVSERQALGAAVITLDEARAVVRLASMHKVPDLGRPIVWVIE